MKTNPGAMLAAQELRNRLELQVVKYAFSIPLTLDIPAGGTAQEVLTMSSEGDFLCEAMTCKLVAYDNAGNVVPPASFGGTGILWKLKDGGFGRELLRDFVRLETMAVPGYGETIYQPWPFKNVLCAQSEQIFNFHNVSGFRHVVEMVFHGYQFRGSFRKEVASA